MPKVLLALEAIGWLLFFAGMVAIPLGIGLMSPAFGLIVAGIELILAGTALLWLTNPTFQRMWQAR